MNSGGNGAFVNATLAVTPFQTLHLFVGGKGGSPMNGDKGGTGGFNGGGAGNARDSFSGGGGGTSSFDVLICKGSCPFLLFFRWRF